ncbi:MAG: glycoside hydrolase family 9 protein [Gemmatimonadetes bacterium]|nr:glycoside hydrolase family 9 protein [Gemmatimonadota bacterium]
MRLAVLRRAAPALAALAFSTLAPTRSHAQANTAPRGVMPIEFVHSAEYGWFTKPVLASRVVDDMTDTTRWRVSGAGKGSYVANALGDMRSLRVDLTLNRPPLPERLRLPAVNLRRVIAGEDWSQYNRIAIWIKPDFNSVPVLPLQLVMHNDGATKVPDRYNREGTHVITLARQGWQQVLWEIDPLARDKVTLLEIGYFVNRMLAGPDDRVAFEIGRIELQRVEPDVHTGWAAGAGRFAFSHSGYLPQQSKVAVMSGLAAQEFDVVRVGDNAFSEHVLRLPVRAVTTATGTHQLLDFTRLTAPGTYVLRVASYTSKPFVVGPQAWRGSIDKTLNFYYGNRCGFEVPGVHDIDHRDWFATLGSQRISMSGGWHDAGDLSQGVINTGEGTYALFALARQVERDGGDPALVERLLEEARWGLDWVLRLRFDGGYRVGFGSHNFWTNNIVGDGDDRTVEAKNNPNANYISAAAEALAARLLRTRDTALAERALRTARADWDAAIVGIEGPSTWHTPAFAASRMELAGIGITASLELWHATREAKYRDKAVELARTVVQSQQVTRVGSTLPLSGFFYTGPDRDTIFHQFHRAADQAPIVALAQLVEALPDHAEWMSWYATIARYAEYQKRTAQVTAPYDVLPAYVYRVVDSVQVPDSGGRYMEKQGEYAEQVRAGTPMGGGWFLRTFPVWFQRRGNYGVLLSQAKGLSAASRLRGDSSGMALAFRQAEWVVGRNPFTQSTMYGEGYDWAQQYSVSSGDLVGALPVGMQSKGVTDLPYWPSQNMYVYKEVWVHSSNRWIWLMEDLLARPVADADAPRVVLSAAEQGATVRITATITGRGAHRWSLRAENLTVPAKTVVQGATLHDGAPTVLTWTARRVNANAPVVAVLVEEGAPGRRAEVYRE